MILGRSPVLWYALLVAIVNALVVFGVFTPTIQQTGAVDAVALALLGWAANERDPLSVGTLAPTIHALVQPVASSVPAPVSSPGVPTSTSPVMTATTTPDPLSVIQSIVEAFSRYMGYVSPTPYQPVPPAPFAPLVSATASTAPATPAVAPATATPLPAESIDTSTPATPASVVHSSSWAAQNDLPPDA